MRYEDETFVQERVELDGNEFRSCRFESCRLVYGGDPGVRVEDCAFDETRLELVEEAGNTISFLQNVFHGFGPDGRRVVEHFFDQIREGKVGQPETTEMADR